MPHSGKSESRKPTFSLHCWSAAFIWMHCPDDNEVLERNLTCFQRRPLSLLLVTHLFITIITGISDQSNNPTIKDQLGSDQLSAKTLLTLFWSVLKQSACFLLIEVTAIVTLAEGKQVIITKLLTNPSLTVSNLSPESHAVSQQTWMTFLLKTQPRVLKFHLKKL